MLAVLLMAVLLGTLGRWVASGCPMGFTCNACEVAFNGRSVIASSDHLLADISLRQGKDSAAVGIEGRRIVVQAGGAMIDDISEVVIPRVWKLGLHTNITRPPHASGEWPQGRGRDASRNRKVPS